MVRPACLCIPGKTPPEHTQRNPTGVHVTLHNSEAETHPMLIIGCWCIVRPAMLCIAPLIMLFTAWGLYWGPPLPLPEPCCPKAT